MTVKVNVFSGLTINCCLMYSTKVDIMSGHVRIHHARLFVSEVYYYDELTNMHT